MLHFSYMQKKALQFTLPLKEIKLHLSLFGSVFPDAISRAVF